jgi:hypothetical protein
MSTPRRALLISLSVLLTTGIACSRDDPPASIVVGPRDRTAAARSEDGLALGNLGELEGAPQVPDAAVAVESPRRRPRVVVESERVVAPPAGGEVPAEARRLARIAAVPPAAPVPAAEAPTASIPTPPAAAEAPPVAAAVEAPPAPAAEADAPALRLEPVDLAAEARRAQPEVVAVATPERSLAPAPVADSCGVALTRSLLARRIENREPVGVADAFEADGERVYLFMEVDNRAGPEAALTVRWTHAATGEVFEQVVRAGRSPSWRTWAHRTLFPNLTGSWRVEVVTSSGCRVGAVDFDVTGV